MTNKSIGNIILGHDSYDMISLNIKIEERVEKNESLGLLPGLPVGILLTTYEQLNIFVEIVSSGLDIACLDKTQVPVKIISYEKTDCNDVFRCRITHYSCRDDIAKLTLTTPPKKAYERFVKF